MERSGYGLIYGTVVESVWRVWGKSQKHSLIRSRNAKISAANFGKRQDEYKDFIMTLKMVSGLQRRMNL